MKLRCIYVWDAADGAHVFMFLVLDDGIEFEFADGDAVPLFEIADHIAPAPWPPN